MSGTDTLPSGLVAITAAAHDAGLYCNLITSAVGITLNRLAALAEAPVDHLRAAAIDCRS